MSAIVSTCGCGEVYDLGRFRELPLGGAMESGLPGVRLELHHCPCGSTRAIHIDDAGLYLTDAQVAGLDAGTVGPFEACEFFECCGCGSRFPTARARDVHGEDGKWCESCHDDHAAVIEYARADDTYDDG